MASEECWGLARQPSLPDIPNYCLNSLADFPKVVFDVRWPQYEGDELLIECNTAQTPGEDCFSLIKQYAPFIAWGTQLAEPYSMSIIVSSSSMMVRQMGMETGRFGQEVLRGLTLGAFDAKPLLGVKFLLDSGAKLAGAFGGDWIGALAYAVLRNANLPLEVSYASGAANCTRQRFADGECDAPQCLHRYSAGGADEVDFGLSTWRQRAAPSGGLCELPNVNDAQVLSGTRPIKAECGMTVIGSAQAVYGYERSCAVDADTLGGSPQKALCVVYLMLTISLGVFVASIATWLFARHSACLQEDTRREIRSAFPQLRLIAAREDRDVSEVVARSSSLLMVLEVSLDGELSTSFIDFRMGLHGALLHAAFVVGLALPVHANAYFQSVRLTWQTIVLCVHYATFITYLVLYYLRALPFGSPRLMLLLRCLMRLSMFVFFITLTVQLAWMVSAIAYDQEYVTSLFLAIGSVLGYVYSVVSASSRIAKIQHLRLQHAGGAAGAVPAVSDGLQAVLPSQLAQEATKVAKQTSDAVTEATNVVKQASDAAAEATKAATQPSDAAAEAAPLALAAKHASAAMESLQLSKRESMRVLLLGGLLLAIAVVFTLFGSFLWNSGGGGFSVAQLAMPLSVIGTKLISDRKLQTAKEG